MIQTILVPLDGSPLAEGAIPTAEWLALRLGADLRLVTTTWSEPGGGEQEYLDALVTRLDVRPDRAVTAEVVDHRFPGEGVAAAAAGVPGALVCLRTHGRSGWGEAVFGSVAENVLRLWPGPLVVVGPEVGEGPPAETSPIVVCYDGSTVAAAIEPTVVPVARALGVPVVVLGVEQHDPIVFGNEEPSPLPERVAAMASRLGAEGLEVSSEVVEDGDPAVAIDRWLRTTPASLVALASHGRSGLSRTLIGSVAMRVVRHSPVPALLVHAAER